MTLSLSKKHTGRPEPVSSVDNLRRRVERLLTSVPRRPRGEHQLTLGLADTFREEDSLRLPTSSIGDFLSFLTDSVPEGEVYLFGGVLRDLALLGGRGFNSDIDVVVEAGWDRCSQYLDHLGATRNKFGGYRLEVAGWKVDVWNALETWAIRENIVKYKGIASLTETTVLNWDAVLMNWRTRAFIFRENYLRDIQSRLLDIVLEQNPDPKGMAVRVYRHLCLKEAKSVTSKALEYLANCTALYSLTELIDREVRSYGKSVIEPAIFRFFEHLKSNERLDIDERIRVAGEITQREVGEISLLAP